MGPTVLVAFSSFKGSLTNEEACAAAAAGLQSIKFSCIICPVGDGGLGTARAVYLARGGEWKKLTVSGPLDTKTEAQILLTKDGAVYLEGPQAFGHHLIPESQRDPLRASSRGLGEMIAYAIREYPKAPLYIGLGDSAISDAGVGMLSALGVRFLDRSGREVPPDANGLRLFDHWQFSPSFPKNFPKITVLCDVLNPLCGPTGSAKIFSPQKGASPAQVTLIDQGMENFAGQVEKQFGKRIRSQPMTGSAGGAAAALFSFLGAELVQGASYLLDWIGFDDQLKLTNFLLVGEGKSDAQTLSGKAPFECLRRASARNIPGVLISGALGVGYGELSPYASVHACGREPSSAEALKQKVAQVFSAIDRPKV